MKATVEIKTGLTGAAAVERYVISYAEGRGYHRRIAQLESAAPETK